VNPPISRTRVLQCNRSAIQGSRCESLEPRNSDLITSDVERAPRLDFGSYLRNGSAKLRKTQNLHRRLSMESAPHPICLLVDKIPSPRPIGSHNCLEWCISQRAEQGGTLQLTSTLRFVTFALKLFLSLVKLSRMANGAVGS
jgi:hypothetical protein